MYKLIFESLDFIVVLKDPGVLSIKARGDLEKEKSLYDLLFKKYGEIYIVHRLDKDTSGLILFARNKEAHKFFCSLFERKIIDKRYLALVFGVIEKDEFVIDKPIKEFGSGRMGISIDGKKAITKFRVIKRFDKYTLIEAKPITGRRHQIRVHLYSYGNPIVGDKLYGDINTQRKYKRMMLHSSYLSFLYKGENYIFKNDEDFLIEVDELLKIDLDKNNL
jgi:RluA family pseudouridine synthase